MASKHFKYPKKKKKKLPETDIRLSEPDKCHDIWQKICCLLLWLLAGIFSFHCG